MDSLKHTQKRFMQALLNPSNSDAFLECVESSQRLSAQGHLAIYQRSYISRLQQCMAAQFEALKSALGDELFFLFTAEYLRTYPSQSYTLNNLGELFSAFLASTRPALQSDDKEDWPAFIIELAAFEYRLNVLFDLPEPTGVNAVKPADDNTPASQLVLNPIHEAFTHQYPVCGYFKAQKNQEFVEIPLPEKEHCLVIRSNYRLMMISLDSLTEQLLINMLLDGKNWENVQALDSTSKKDKLEDFSQIKSANLAESEISLEEIHSLKSKWIKNGVLVSFKR